MFQNKVMVGFCHYKVVINISFLECAGISRTTLENVFIVLILHIEGAIVRKTCKCTDYIIMGLCSQIFSAIDRKSVV